MPRWRALPDELDPQVREFASQLRRLVDRSGLSIASVADRTGYSKTSWERYLNGRLLAPKGAIVALADSIPLPEVVDANRQITHSFDRLRQVMSANVLSVRR